MSLNLPGVNGSVGFLCPLPGEPEVQVGDVCKELDMNLFRAVVDFSPTSPSSSRQVHSFSSRSVYVLNSVNGIALTSLSSLAEMNNLKHRALASLDYVIQSVLPGGRIN